MAIQDQPWFEPPITRTESELLETEIVGLILSNRIELAIDRFLTRFNQLSEEVSNKIFDRLVSIVS